MLSSEMERLICGLATAVAGLAVAVTMSEAGGSLARFLPNAPGFHVAAVAGAGLAGVTLADGFGRPGRAGVALGVLTAPVVTAVGAALAALLLTIVMALLLWATGDNGMHLGTVTDAPVLGLLAITDGVGTSPVVAGTWTIAMVGVQIAMRRVRQR